jgi:hypothetical protein
MSEKTKKKNNTQELAAAQKDFDFRSWR